MNEYLESRYHTIKRAVIFESELTSRQVSRYRTFCIIAEYFPDLDVDSAMSIIDLLFFEDLIVR